MTLDSVRYCTLPHMIGLVGVAAPVCYVAVAGIDLRWRGCTPAEVAVSVAIVLSLQIVVGGGLLWFFARRRRGESGHDMAQTKNDRN